MRQKKILWFTPLVCIVCGALAFFLAPVAYRGPALIVTLIVCSTLGDIAQALLLGWHWRRIHRLRYIELRPQQALRELRWWKSLLEPKAYHLMQAGMMVQAGMYESVGQLLDDPSLGEAERENTRFNVFCNQDKWLEAEAAVRAALAAGSGTMKTGFKVELARHLAEHAVEKLPEAFQLYQEALQEPTVAGIEPIFLSLEAPLWLAADEADKALRILEAQTAAMEAMVAGAAHSIPYLALHHRWRGRALWALGRNAEAREALLRARETYRDERFQRRIDTDLGHLNEGQALFEVAPDLDFVQAYAAGFTVRTTWPGGHASAF